MKKLFIALMLAGVLVSVDASARVKKACPAGTYSKTGSTSVADCIKCSTLGEKRYNDQTGQSTCKTCSGNQIANAEGTGCVAGCKDNQLRGVGTNGKITCSTCPANATCDGSENFTCKTGHYKSGKTCKKCPANATCTETEFTCNAGYEPNGTTGCKTCEAGYYCE